MEIPSAMVAHFEKAKEQFKKSLCAEIDQFRLSMCHRVDSMFAAFLQDIKMYNNHSRQPGSSSSSSGSGQPQLATFLANAVYAPPVVDPSQHQHQQFEYTTFFSASQPGSKSQAIEDSTDIEGDNSIEAAVGGHGNAGCGLEDYSGTVGYDLEIPDFDAEEEVEDTSEDAFCLNNLYWINKETPYRSCLLSGRFSALNFDFGINATESEKRWAMQPAAAIKECVDARGPTERFPDYFNYFANDIFKRLGDVYPYEVPRQVIDSVVTIFCYQYRVLDQYFQAYKRKWPEHRFSRCVNTIELLGIKVKNKFKVRSNELKKEGLWIYRTPYEREKYGSAVVDEAKKARRRWKPDCSFDYVAWKPKMEEKMEQLVEEKALKKEKRGSGRRKRRKTTAKNGAGDQEEPTDYEDED